MTALAAAYGADQLGDRQALTNGFSTAFIGTAPIAAVGALVAAVALRARRTVSDARETAARVEVSSASR